MGQRSQPWFIQGAISYLESILTPNMVMFEWGAGRSTQWFADRVKSIVSIEHQEKWYQVVACYLKNRNNAKLYLADVDKEEYPKAISRYPDETFDLVVIDGRRRCECTQQAIPKVKTNGYLLLDDMERSRYESAKALLSSWPLHEFTGDTRGRGRKTTGIYQKCLK